MINLILNLAELIVYAKFDEVPLKLNIFNQKKKALRVPSRVEVCIKNKEKHL